MKGTFNTRNLAAFLWSQDTRSAELLIAQICLMRGVFLALPTQSMSPMIYSGHLAMMPEWAWGLLEATAGIFAIAGILINGRWRKSPWLRVSGAIITGAIFASLTMTFQINSPLQVSLAVAVYLAITIGAIWCALNVASKA